MGLHHAPPTFQAGRIAGKGALTAAAVLAVAGGTASVASAHEAPARAHHAAHEVHHAASSEGSWKGVADRVIDVKHKVNDLSAAPDPTLIDVAQGAGLKGPVDQVIDVKHKVNDLNSSVDPTLLQIAHQADHGSTGNRASFLSFA